MVPTVHVNLLPSTQILPHQSKVVDVALADHEEAEGAYFLKAVLQAASGPLSPANRPRLSGTSCHFKPNQALHAPEEGDTLGKTNLVEMDIDTGDVHSCR